MPTNHQATGEYVTDVPYLRHFVHDLSPTELRIAAALNGFAPPPADDFDYCELGAGNGDTVVTLAAAYPKSRFVGVDLNPAHVAVATGLATKGGLTNVRFLERDFEDLALEEGARFDYITANGVLSWVSPEKQAALIALAAERLKPGGILYVSYNALPGWAAIQPLRALLVDMTKGVSGGTLERARQGIQFAKLLAAGKAAYFTSNPAAEKMLATMLDGGLPYIAHEYFHAHWRAMYFGEVAREMAEKGLHFIGQLPLHANYRDLTIPEALLPAFRTIEDRILFESLKDFAQNELFRRDVYVRGVVGRTEAATRAYLDQTAFGTLVEEEQMLREVQLAHYKLRFRGPVFDALVRRVAHGASTVAELVADDSLEPFGADRVREGLRTLTLGGQVVPMMQSTPGAVADPKTTYEIPLAYNRMVLAQPLSEETTFIVASPVAGSGFTLSLLEATCIHLVTRVAAKDRDAWIRRTAGDLPVKVQVEGRSIDDPAERERVLQAELGTFLRRRLPKLVELGVLAPADSRHRPIA